MSHIMNYKLRVKTIIKTLNQWAKKPTLDHDISAVLDDYYSIVNSGFTNVTNFAETAVIIQAYTSILEKRIDLLFKEFFALSIRLCSALRRPEEEIQEQQTANISPETQVGHPEVAEIQVQVPQPEVTQPTNKPAEPNKDADKKEKGKRKRKGKVEEVAESSKKLTIPGLPDEILESLNLTECNLDDVVRECLNKLTPTHPLYSVFAKIGDEISRTKNLITYNDISLSGKSWNILYVLENLLNKYRPENLEENNLNTTNATDINTMTQSLTNGNVDNCASLNETEITASGTNTLTCTQTFDSGIEDFNSMLENNDTQHDAQNSDTPQDVQDSSDNQNCATDENDSQNTAIESSTEIENTCATKHTAESNSDNWDKEVEKLILLRYQNQIKEVRINLLQLPDNIFSNVNYFQLPDEYLKWKHRIKDVRINLFRLPTNILSNADYFKLPEKYLNISNNEPISDAKLRKQIATKCKMQIKDIKINLLRLPHTVLFRVNYFQLTNEYFNTTKKRKVEQTVKKLMTNPQVITRKRQRELDRESMRLVKKLKSYDLDDFEKFCDAYNVNQGLCSPVPEKVCISRKSVDNRSEVSYGYPVTPDSGRFSLSAHTDSEFEHTDFDLDPDSDHRRTLSRADSGCCVMSPPHDCEIDSALPFSSEPVPAVEEDPTLQKLKEMFPNSFADPQRAEFLKSLVRLPEEQHESENYVEWKKFIDHKTARETEFNIHEYGTQILDSFPTKTKNEKIGFQSVVQNKSIGDISRFFVSALQLANTYNVEICDDRQGQVTAEGFNLKFLSEERHHEEFEELSLPSESHFFDNLPSTSFGHSTPHSSLPSSSRTALYSQKTIKRRRVDYTYQ